MEKTKVITIPLPIQECYERLPPLIQRLHWRTVLANPATHFLWWRKGDDWLLKRRHDLYISLYERDANATKVVLTIKAARLTLGGSELVSQDIAEIVEHIQGHLRPIRQRGVAPF